MQTQLDKDPRGGPQGGHKDRLQDGFGPRRESMHESITQCILDGKMEYDNQH
jgi:hypothetical protein